MGVLCATTDGFLNFYQAVGRENLRFNLDTANQFVLKDNLGRDVGKFNNGEKDTIPVSGLDLITTIDIDLQAYVEELMDNKIGGVVAIEPKTGEILAFASSPTYDPKAMVIGLPN